MKPMHGSVSQPSIDELLVEYVLLLEKADQSPLEQCERRYRLNEEIARRIGSENATQRILEMQVTLRALTGT